MSQLSYISAAQALRAAGFGGGQGGKLDSPANVRELATALAIGMAESGLKTDAKNYNPPKNGHPGTWDYGFMQINTVHGVSFNDMKNPDACATAAWKVYSEAGKSFSPWTTYRLGLHVVYMPGAWTAAKMIISQHGDATGAIPRDPGKGFTAGDTSLTSPVGNPLKGIDAVGQFFTATYGFFFQNNGALRILYIIAGIVLLFLGLRIFTKELT